MTAVSAATVATQQTSDAPPPSALRHQGHCGTPSRTGPSVVDTSQATRAATQPTCRTGRPGHAACQNTHGKFTPLVKL